VVTSRRQLFWPLAVLLVSLDASAAVVARVDRTDIELNESFTLEVVTDKNIDLQPDVSPLETDFYVGQSSQLSNTTIVNGQIERSKTWTFVLMPKRAGEMIIPAISIGGQRSQPLRITVSEPSYAPPGEAEVFITSELDLEQTYVQAQALLTIKIYRSVATRQPALREPSFDGVEYLIETAGDDRSYEAVIDGTAYSVVERVYALYPQESGVLTISPARFEARVLRAGRITGRKVYQSEPQLLTVLPIPAPPAEYPQAAWLPAKDLQVSEDWSRDPVEIKAGEPLTRHVSISALGQLETQIPALQAPESAGINVYPDKPTLSRKIETGGIRGIRKDQYAIIGTRAGTVVLPELTVPWWNIEQGRWQVAVLPQRSLQILPTAEVPLPEPQSVAETAVADDATPAATPAAASGFWRRATELLGALWLLTLIAWWWSSRPSREPKAPRPVPIHRQQAKALKAARKAALAGDDAGVRHAMLEWARLQWPQAAPRSIGELAGRVSPPLADELQRLSRSSYGPDDGDWDDEALARSMRSFAVLDDDGNLPEEPLPPLLPGTQ
jgi:hypothetical protein